MSKYSSDSDSSLCRRKKQSKRRSSSVSSSESSRRKRSRSSRHHKSTRYKKSKSYNSRSHRRSRSRSRSKSKTKSRHSRSSSKDFRTRRSGSRDRHKRSHHYQSKSYTKGNTPNHRSRSTSSDSKNSSTSTTSKSSSNHSKKKIIAKNSTPNSEDLLKEKLLKAIKAAESADHQLKQQGVLPEKVKSRNDINNFNCNRPNSDVIQDINSDSFVQKTFISTKQKKEELYGELNNPVKVEDSLATSVDEKSIFHASFFVDPKIKLDRWVKKLYQIRQKAISGEVIPD